MYDLYYIYFDGDGPNLGTCVIPNELGGLIQDVCVERERFLDLGRKGYPPIEFYAVEQWDGYVLHYGDPRKAPELPSLGEFVEKRGYDHSDDKSLREYLAEFGGGDQGNDQEIAAAMQSIRVKLNDPITDGELEYWWEWDHAMEKHRRSRILPPHASNTGRR